MVCELVSSLMSPSLGSGPSSGLIARSLGAEGTDRSMTQLTLAGLLSRLPEGSLIDELPTVNV